MSDPGWRERAERVLLRPVPALLRDRPMLMDMCPWYFIAAAGARLRATDGREYLDLEMGQGANILGYGHPVTEAVITSFRPMSARASLYHTVEIELAEMLVEIVPCAESVIFGKNGSDACTAAVRTARAATGRSVIVSSGYHGFHDWCSADMPDTDGFPDGYRGWVERVELNDRERLERLFAERGAAIAGIIVEPAHRVLPDESFLHTCRSLADAHGAVLIFDEVVTAFRLDLGGAQTRFGVVPDLACLGKAMTNGYALSALVGRRDVLPALELSFFSMTYQHDAPAFAAAKACLTHLRDTGALGPIAAKGERLRNAFDTAAQRNGLPARAVGFSARLDLDFPAVGLLDGATQATLFGAALVERGVLPTTSIFACEVLSERDIEQAGEAFELGMARIREQLEQTS